jgi:hypothetical protein
MISIGNINWSQPVFNGEKVAMGMKEEEKQE